MIISHKHKFIFLHCRKVAGSSITIYLNRFIGPRDLQIGVWADTMAAGGKYNRQAWIDMVSSTRSLKATIVNCAKEIWAMIIKGRNPKLSRVVNVAVKARYRGVIGAKPEHPLAKEVRQFAPREWDEYFKFCFVRNPYDRVVSDFCWRTKNRKDINFLEFLKRLDNPSRPDPERIIPRPSTNWPIYTIDDNVVVDFVGRFESLNEDFAKICERLNLPFDDSLLFHAKKSGNIKGNYQNWYGAEERKLVERVFAKEIKYFDYRF